MEKGCIINNAASLNDINFQRLLSLCRHTLHYPAYLCYAVPGESTQQPLPSLAIGGVANLNHLQEMETLLSDELNGKKFEMHCDYADTLRCIFFGT